MASARNSTRNLSGELLVLSCARASFHNAARKHIHPHRFVTTTWYRKLLLFVAILVMPVQGVAMAATFGKCHEKAAAELAAHVHEHDGSAHHPHHESGDESGATSMNGHLCGHIVLHLPVAFEIVIQPRFAAWTVSAVDSYTPHFPEHPRRPPRV